MKINTKNSPVTIRVKPVGTTLIQFVVINLISGEETLFIFDYTKKYVEVKEEEANDIAGSVIEEPPVEEPVVEDEKEEVNVELKEEVINEDD